MMDVAIDVDDVAMYGIADLMITQKRIDYSMETNLVQHSGSFDWKVNCAAARKGVVRSDTLSPNTMCRTKWRMDVSFVNIKTNEMSLRLRRTDTDGDNLIVSIHITLLNSVGVEFKEDCVKCFNWESGSDWRITFQKPSRQKMVCLPTVSGDRQIVRLLEDREFFVKARIEVKDCCPVTKTSPVRKFVRQAALKSTGESVFFPINLNDPTSSFSFEHACQIDWKITNFPRYSDKIISPIFAPVAECKTRWKIIITFLPGDVEQMRVSIHRVDDEVIKGLPDFYLSVKNSRRDKYYQERVEAWITKEWGILSCRPSHTQPLLKPDSRCALFRLDKDETLLVTAVITLNRCCGYIPDADVFYT